jgi:hypothetical protein
VEADSSQAEIADAAKAAEPMAEIKAQCNEQRSVVKAAAEGVSHIVSESSDGAGLTLLSTKPR